MLKNGPIVNYCSQRNNGSLLRFSVRVQNWDLVEVNIPLPWICSDVVSCTYAYDQVRRFLYQHLLTKIGLKEEQNPKKKLGQILRSKWNRGPRFLKCFKIQWGEPIYSSEQFFLEFYSVKACNLCWRQSTVFW